MRLGTPNFYCPWPLAIAVVVIAVLVAWGVHANRKGWRDYEEEQRWWHDEQNPSLATLRTNGLNSIREDCSNEVVGLSRIVRVGMSQDGTVTGWRGEAVVEFVNKVGGVERKTRHYLFSELKNDEGGTKDVFAFEDPQDFEKELQSILKNR